MSYRHNFLVFFLCFFLPLLLQFKFANSTLLSVLRFSSFITPYDAQASSAFSALIFNKGGKLLNKFQFYYKNCQLALVSQYKYLGLTICSSGKIDFENYVINV